MNKFLFTRIDNTGLVLFRVVFGLLIAAEGFGAIATGWVRRTLVEPDFTFNFIGFEFLQPLPGSGMYIYFALMGTFGLMVMLGYKYRISIISYAVLWTGVYFMQKTSYNNHYYLLMLLCWIMAFLPANRWLSLDVRRNPEKKSTSMPRWCLWVLILQVWIVYTYASVAKIYPDWLDGSVAELFMTGKKGYWLIGDLLQQAWAHYTIAYAGIFFDLLIIPMLLWKRTRMIGFILSIFFHLFNSIIFQIGIFPYMSMAFAFFFFTPQTLTKRFLPKKPIYTAGEVIIPSYRKPFLIIFSVYFLIQVGLPLRHWFFQDDVLWTEEGHRLSWRMMLRSKSAKVNYWIVDKETGERTFYNYFPMLSKKQRRSIRTHPDMIWQLAQRIKKIEGKKGKDVAVYVTVDVKVNKGVYHPFIDPEVDLASEKWHHFKHHDWILPSPEDYGEKPEEAK